MSCKDLSHFKVYLQVILNIIMSLEYGTVPIIEYMFKYWQKNQPYILCFPLGKLIEKTS